MAMRYVQLVVLCCFICGCSGKQVWAKTYAIEDDVIGDIQHYSLKKDDTLAEVARKFDIGLVELLAANPSVQRQPPQPNTVLTITSQHILPEPRQGIVLNLSELRLFYFMSATQVFTAPITIGKEGWQTPLGVTTIIQKRKHPEWIPTESIRLESPHLPAVIPAGPDNPLGLYALNLGWPSYAIHGTNDPDSIGKRVSHGCIRLYPEDIETLFKAVEVGTSVTIIDTPYKLGWQRERLFLEVTPTQLQADALIQHRKLAVVNPHDIYPAIKQLNQQMNQRIKINWEAVEMAVTQRTGLPVLIGVRSAVKMKRFKP